MFKNKNFQKESGNAVIIVLVVLVIAAVGALAFLSGQFTGDKDSAPVTASASEEPASGTQTVDNAPDPASESAQAPLPKEGNPVVAKLNGKDISRLDVFNFMQTLPQQVRQLPLEQLFPIAREQFINARIISEKTESVKLDNDPEVKKQLEEAKKQIVRSVYIQNKVEERVTDERLQQAYEAYKAGFPEVEEVKARHILVKEEDEAKDILKKIKDGGDFAALADEYSKDVSGERGGELGYFLKTDVVPEFGEAAFGMEPGEMVSKPVKTEFGYHIIETLDKRKAAPKSFEEVKPFLEVQLRRIALDELVQEWREQAEIERFDINGDAIEPAAGGQDAAPAPAPAEAQ